MISTPGLLGWLYWVALVSTGIGETLSAAPVRSAHLGDPGVSAGHVTVYNKAQHLKPSVALTAAVSGLLVPLYSKSWSESSIEHAPAKLTSSVAEFGLEMIEVDRSGGLAWCICRTTPETKAKFLDLLAIDENRALLQSKWPDSLYEKTPMLILSFRGTGMSKKDVNTDADIRPLYLAGKPGSFAYHQGFVEDLAGNLKLNLLVALQRATQTKNQHLVISGHSLGAAKALLFLRATQLGSSKNAEKDVLVAKLQIPRGDAAAWGTSSRGIMFANPPIYIGRDPKEDPVVTGVRNFESFWNGGDIVVATAYDFPKHRTEFVKKISDDHVGTRAFHPPTDEQAEARLIQLVPDWNTGGIAWTRVAHPMAFYTKALGVKYQHSVLYPWVLALLVVTVLLMTWCWIRRAGTAHGKGAKNQ